LLCSNANTCFAQTQSSAREQIITEEASKATKACIAVFNSTVHGAKGKDFANCLGDQVEKAVGNCPTKSKKDFTRCVLGKTLNVMRRCDVSRCQRGDLASKTGTWRIWSSLHRLKARRAATNSRKL
jgi:hypothetical protein